MGMNPRPRALLVAHFLVMCPAISGKAYVRLGGQPRQVNTRSWPPCQRRGGFGCVQGMRCGYHYARIERLEPLADSREAQWHFVLLARWGISDPQEAMTY